MRVRFVVLVLLCSGVSSGCLFQRKPPYANDPLLLHYKPTLSDSATILAEKQARRGPMRPPMPPASRDATEALAAPSRLDSILPAKTELPVGPTARGTSEPSRSDPLAAFGDGPLPPPPIEVVTALARPDVAKPLAPPPALQESPELFVAAKVTGNPPAPTPETPRPPESRRSVDGAFAHEDDYRWLQGTLDRHYRGYCCLRYRDPSEEDEHGGKMRVQDDNRLTVFQDGDVLGVEGELMTSGSAPRYVIRDVWLVRKKSAN